MNLGEVAASHAGADGVIVVRWTAAQVLAATGSTPNPAVLPIGIAALLAGAALFAIERRGKLKGN